MHKNIREVFIDQKQIQDKCIELGAQLTAVYKDCEKAPVFVALLKGAVPFLAELIKYVELDIKIDFMDVSSYEGTRTTGDIRINKDLDISIKGEDIVLIEDIVDTGRTLKVVKEMLHNKGAKSIIVVSLLDKPTQREVEIEAEYVGFVIPNEFVVGFGLDFNQKFRNLPYIGVLKDECYK